MIRVFRRCRPSRLGLVVICAAALVFAACGGDNGDLSVSVDPESGPPGTVISIDISECDTEPSGSLDRHDEPVEEATFKGSDTGRVTVPQDATPGTYTVFVRCDSKSRETDEGSVETKIHIEKATFKVTD
jgi:hypothetical protein